MNSPYYFSSYCEYIFHNNILISIRSTIRYYKNLGKFMEKLDKYLCVCVCVYNWAAMRGWYRRRGKFSYNHPACRLEFHIKCYQNSVINHVSHHHQNGSASRTHCSSLLFVLWSNGSMVKRRVLSKGSVKKELKIMWIFSIWNLFEWH